MSNPEQPSTDPDNPTLEEGKEILGRVVVESFVAQPPSIDPFGMSDVSWALGGSATDCVIFFEGGRVNIWGSRIVQPRSTISYSLRATAGPASKILATATVDVNLRSCNTVLWSVARSYIDGILRAGIAATPGLTLDDGPSLIVIFETGRINFSMYLKKSVNWLPDPDVVVDAGFDLDVQDGELVARNEVVHVDIKIAPYLWLLPAAPFLALWISQQQGSAEDSIRASIQKLATELNTLYAREAGFRIQNVQVIADSDSEHQDGEIRITECPDDVLRRFRAVSASEPATAAGALHTGREPLQPDSNGDSNSSSLRQASATDDSA